MRVETVGDLENVETADVLHQQLRGSALNVYLARTVGERSTPEEKRASPDTRIIGVEAQRAAMGGRSAHPQAVQSYEPDGAVVLHIVETDENAAHKAHVGVKVVGGARAGIEVRSRARENQIGIGDHAAEVSND